MSEQAGTQQLTQEDRDARGAAAEALLDELRAEGVVGVALPWVDTSGITRVKTVPTAALPAAARWGVGMSGVFDGFLLDDSIVAGRFAGSAVGDLRLQPDLSRLVALAGQPGWAWAPVDRYDQDGAAHPQCSRSLLRRVVAELAADGWGVRAAIEVEWVVSEPNGTAEDPDAFVPALSGPAYGMTRLAEVSDYARDLLAALEAQGVAVGQLHPEYSTAQLEVSVAAEDPVGAADTALLVRDTIRAVSAAHGLRVSFSPKVLADGVGNGGHVHLSLWRDGANAMAGGDGPAGMSAAGASFTAGILGRLPALLAVGAPSVASYLRLVPSHWAGAFAAWGVENRETALRFVTGTLGQREQTANVEVKCVDLTANPYLVLAALLAAGRAGLAAGAELPAPLQVDPGTLDDDERAALGVRALPTSLGEAVAAFEADPVLAEVFGEALAVSLADVRRGEMALLADASPEQVCAAVRWKH